MQVQFADAPEFSGLVTAQSFAVAGSTIGVSGAGLATAGTRSTAASCTRPTRGSPGWSLDHVDAMSAALSGIQAGTFIESCSTQIGVGGETFIGKVAIATG